MRGLRILQTLLISCLALLSIFAPVSSHDEPEPLLGAESRADMTTAELDALSEKPFRPSWAPLPMMRGDTGALPSIHGLLQSDDPATRARAAFLLGQIGSPESVRRLASTLNDPDRNVRVHAGVALAVFGDARGLPVCTAVLSDAPAWVKYYAAYGLWRIDNPRSSETLSKHTHDEDEFIAATIRGALMTDAVPLPAVKSRRADAKSAIIPPDDIWAEYCDVLITESDWWWHKGNFDQSIRCLEASVFLNPLYVDGYSSIAWLQWSMGNDDLAIRTLSRGISANPSEPEAHFALGFHYFRTKRYKSAEDPLRAALRVGGDHRMRRTLAHCLEKLGRLTEAAEQWEAVVAEVPDDEAARRNLERVKGLLAPKTDP